ncbi:MAG: glycosyltransferase [Acidobacteriota bacterium]
MNLPSPWRVYKPKRVSRVPHERRQEHGDDPAREDRQQKKLHARPGAVTDDVRLMRTAVVVVGDLGRSPRMQYHALALAVNAGEVDLVGLEGAAVHPAVAAQPGVRVHRLRERFSVRLESGRLGFVAWSLVRALAHAARLAWTLMRLPRPDLILVQTPPAAPTLGVAWAVARLRGARFVIDWHNLAHTVLAGQLGDRHRAVRALFRSQRRWGRRADGHLTVSQALAEWLHREWGLAADVIYDRPPAWMTTPPPAVADAAWHRLATQLRIGPARVPLVVCPTSWTPEEDFDLLLEALDRTERRLGADAPHTEHQQVEARLALLVTGRGPLKAAFEARLSRRAFEHVAVRTAWLAPEEYPAIIGLADLGLSLHQSSSGVDLPMKLADFRGVGVPACALDYAPVLGEVLTPGREGVTFNDPGELSRLLLALARRNDAAGSALASARAWLAAHPPERWEESWLRTAPRVLSLAPEASSN